MLRRAFSQNPSTQKQTFLILKMEFKCSKELDFWKSKRYFYWTKVAAEVICHIGTLDWA